MTTTTTQPTAITVLLVDNEPLVRTMLAEVLRGAGFNVSTASSGTEALDMVQAAPPGLVLMDVQMPGFSGWDALARLQETNPGLLVVMMSGTDCREEARERGAAGFLAKPYRPRDVLDYLQEITGGALRA